MKAATHLTRRKRGHTAAMAFIACSFALGDPAAAQTGGAYDLSWSTIDGGGGFSSAGSFEVYGVAGQPEHQTATGGAFAVAGGFLGTFAGLEPPDPPTLVNLQFISSSMFEVTFSEPMGAGVLNAANYTVTGAGKGSLAANPTTVLQMGPTTYRLIWVGGSPVGGQLLAISVNLSVTDTEGETMGSPSLLSITVPGTTPACFCPQ